MSRGIFYETDPASTKGGLKGVMAKTLLDTPAHKSISELNSDIYRLKELHDVFILTVSNV